MGAEPDSITLIEANLGVGMLPESATKSDRIRLLGIEGLDLKRTVYLYGVAGRERSAAASALIRLDARRRLVRPRGGVTASHERRAFSAATIIFDIHAVAEIRVDMARDDHADAAD